MFFSTAFYAYNGYTIQSICFHGCIKPSLLLVSVTSTAPSTFHTFLSTPFSLCKLLQTSPIFFNFYTKSKSSVENKVEFKTYPPLFLAPLVLKVPFFYCSKLICSREANVAQKSIDLSYF